MNGCSLQEAFPDTEKEKSPNNHKKRKEKKSSALDFLRNTTGTDSTSAPVSWLGVESQTGNTEGFQANNSDPDRQTPALPPVETLKDEKEKVDVIGSHTVDGKFNPPAALKSQNKSESYFGTSGSDDSSENFADFNRSLDDNPGYNLDLLGQSKTGTEKAQGNGLLSIPSVFDNWKASVPNTGSKSSYFDYLPAPEPKNQMIVKNDIQKKIDTLFARLEELESKRNDNAQAEISLFIISGLFLIFSLEAIRKM